MSPTSKYPHGTPIWVDLSTTDVPAAVSFYGELFGWAAEDLGEQAGHYNMFRKDGKQVAAANAVMDPHQPPAWTTYVSTADAKATADKVRAAGGTVALEPMQVMDAGSMAVFQDPTGAFFAVWQPGNMAGAELFNEPGSQTWNELGTRDMDRAKKFYTEVFGWGIKDSPMGPDTSYTEFQIDGKSIAGGMPMGDNFPASVPANWLVYFAVEDPDATVAKAESLGGKVMMGTQQSPAGPFAVLADPQGAAFAIIKMSS